MYDVEMCQWKYSTVKMNIQIVYSKTNTRQLKT